MQTYSPLSSRVRIAAGVASVVISTAWLGAQLSLFERVSNEAAVAHAKSNAAPASSVMAERKTRAAKRS